MKFKAYLKSVAFIISIYALSVIVWGIGFVMYSKNIETLTVINIVSSVLIANIPILMLSIISIPISLVIEFVTCSETSHINAKGIFIAFLMIMVILFFMLLFYKTKELHEGIFIYMAISSILLLTAYIKFMFARFSKTISPAISKRVNV